MRIILTIDVNFIAFGIGEITTAGKQIESN